MHKYLLILLLGMCLAGINPVLAQQARDTNPQGIGNPERYAYQYIVELYDVGDTEQLHQQIKLFYAQYPASELQPYVQFIEAGLYLESRNSAMALDLYTALLNAPLDLSVRHQVYLNRAISLYLENRFAEAMHQLQSLNSESRDEGLLAEANLYRARVYRRMGQFFSAKKAYQEALEVFEQDPEISLELFETIISLNQDSEAEKLLAELTPATPFYLEYLVKWAEYLLGSYRYQEFDQHIAAHPELDNVLQVNLLKLKKAFEQNDLNTASRILDGNTAIHDQVTYYKALLARFQGNSTLADSLFTILVKKAEPEIKVLSYLQRLIILYDEEPFTAMMQLGQYITAGSSEIAKAEQYYTLGYFAFGRQDYQEALRRLSLARAESQDKLQLARIDILIGKAWLKAGRTENALNAFNRYLNLYPEGANKDEALYYLGALNFEAKNYSLSRGALEKLVREVPGSIHVPGARFYLAEMDFFLANYNLALNGFIAMLDAEPTNAAALLRIAQIYFYQGNLDESERYLQRLTPGYDSLILQGHINFNRKQYATALEYFTLSERAADNPLRTAEAQSYRALTLYQMKRYKEASELYLKLFKGQEGADTYLYLGAKAAYSAGDYHQALKLYDDFVDTYPDSPYFLQVLAEIANTYYNMGNHPQAVRDYRNILSRFRNSRGFDESEIAFLQEVFTGLELSLSRIDDVTLINDIALMSETFQSEYITFELSYLLVKLFAVRSQWVDLLETAESLRSEFPQKQRREVEMLMVQSLINLNQYSRADSLLSSLYTETGDTSALLEWADLEVLTEDYASALAKYQAVYAAKPGSEIWLKMLKTSTALAFDGFDVLWQMGEVYLSEVPQALLLRLEYLVADARLEEASGLTDQIIANSLNTYDHATAFLYKGIIAYENSDFGNAISELRKVLMLFSDIPDIVDKAAYQLIKTYLQMGAYTDASMLFWQYAPRMSEVNIRVINQLLEEQQ